MTHPQFSFALVAAALLLVIASHAATPQVGYPVPQIIGPTHPTAVAPGGPGFTVKVYGANFINGSVVNWNKQARTTTFVSGHELDAQILASDIAVNTAGMITVTTTGPNGPITSSTYSQVEVHRAQRTIGPLQPKYYAHWILSYAADVNGDGYLDLAGLDFASRALGVRSFLNQGDGTFEAGPYVTLRNSSSGGPFQFGDFNGDGVPDFLYTVGNGLGYPYHLKVNLGNGDGTFLPGAIFDSFPPGVIPSPRFAVVGDFNQDGALDVAIQDEGGLPNSTKVFLGNGDGTFTQGLTIHTSPLYGAVVAGDFNNDGKLDIIGVNRSADLKSFEFMFFAGNGDGTFWPPTLKTTISSGPFGIPPCILVTDLNHDGTADLVFGTQVGQIGVMVGNGDGTFQTPVYYHVGYLNYFEFAVGDFNSDGNTDVIVQNNNYSCDFEILLGNGDGTLQGPQVTQQPGGGAVSNILVGDFNHDGLLDFALGIFGEVFLQPEYNAKP